MIAGPPVRGFHAERVVNAERVVTASLYVVGVVAGSLGLGFAVSALGTLVGHLPLWILTGFSLTLAVGLVVNPNWRPLSSRWMVPKQWARFGAYGYAVLFGVVLGFSLLTQLSSVGIYVLLAYGWSTREWMNVWPVFLAFGLAKTVPAWLAAYFPERNLNVMAKVGIASNFAIRSRPLEVAALACVGLASLLQ